MARARDDYDDEYDDDRRPRGNTRADRGGSRFNCPFCSSNSPPIRKQKISTAGWVLFVILLIGCFPLCVIGLFITEDHRVCSDCGITLG